MTQATDKIKQKITERQNGDSTDPAGSDKHFSSSVDKSPFFQYSFYLWNGKAMNGKKVEYFNSSGSANGWRQSCLCTQLDRHATNQRNETYDVGSVTPLWDRMAARAGCSSLFHKLYILQVALNRC